MRSETEMLRGKAREKEEYESKVVAITDCLQTSLNDLTSKLSKKEVEYTQLHHQHLNTMSDQHTL